MDTYILTTLLFILGVGFHMMQKVSVLRQKYAELNFKVIWGTFFKEEWDSLIVSGLVMGVTILALHIVLTKDNIHVPSWVTDWGVYLIALVLGYSGQRIAYKYLTTAEHALDKKIQEVTDKL